MKTKILLGVMLLTGMSMSMLAQDYWTQKASFGGVVRTGATGLSIGNKGYIGLGTNDSGYLLDFWEYDPDRDVWTQKANFAGAIRTSAAGFSIGNKGYVGTGSFTPGDTGWVWYKDLWEYDPEENTWTQKASLPERYSGGALVKGRNLAVSFSIANHGYLGTGTYRYDRWSTAEYLNDLWEYDAVTDSWTERAFLPTAGRTGASGLSIGTKGYVGLGVHWYDTRLKDWWEFDPEQNKWTRKADLPGDPRYHATGFSIGTRGYVGSGGYYSLLSDFWEYNPSTNQWTRRADLNDGPVYAAVGFSIGSKGYLGTGYGTAYRSSFWEYSPYTITLSCPANVVVPTSSTSCDNVVSGIDPIITVNPPVASVVANYTLSFQDVIYASGTGSVSGMNFQKGTTSVTYSIPEQPDLDCQFTVTVNDQTSPLIQCPEPEIYCFDDSNTYAIPLLITSDNCGVKSVSFAITGNTDRLGTGNDASGFFETGTSLIEWTVTDSSGNISTCQTSVVINAPLHVAIPDVYAVNPGGEPNTIYIGYGPPSLTLTANVTGGTPYPDNTYRYSWSDGSSLPVTTVSPSGVGSYTYTVSVYDQYGCLATLEKTIEVKDVRCGNKLDKVLVCKVPKGNPNQQTSLCLNYYDVGGQLANGSYLGECQSTVYPPSESQLVSIFPNPNNGSFSVQLNNMNSAMVQIRVTDRNGREVGNRNVEVTSLLQTVTMDIAPLQKGVYIVKVFSGSMVITQKMIVK